MIKSIQTKIILIFFILGIIIIGALSIFSINSIKQVEQEVLVNNALIMRSLFKPALTKKFHKSKQLLQLKLEFLL